MPGTSGTSAGSVSDEVERALADPRRIVWLDGVHNFRDLGGYPAAHGVTKWQTVYRADGLGRLSPADIAILRARGLRSVIDLRTETELSERGRYPVDQHDVTFHHLPVLDKTWAAEDLPDVRTEGDFLMWAYRDMLRVGGDKLGQAMRVIATAGSTPLVFHCAAGKDRTGLLAALTLAVIGVSDEFIAADYGKTAEGMQRMRAWAIAQSAEAAERMNEV
ncbi:MAG TPA: tyrosine-protein phosphatase, partial [Ilumatobacteraceae bacterium]